MHMSLPRILFQILLLPVLALVLPLVYAIAWLREAISDATLRRAPVVVSRHYPSRRQRRG
jgi:hypothetical protein